MGKEPSRTLSASTSKKEWVRKVPYTFWPFKKIINRIFTKKCGVFKTSRYKYMSIYTNPMVIRNQKTRIDTQTLEGRTSILLRKSSNHKKKTKRRNGKKRTIVTGKQAI